MNNFQEKVGFIWSVADLLRGDYKQADYGKVILPLTVLRRLDCVLEPTKDEGAREGDGAAQEGRREDRRMMLCQAAGEPSTTPASSTFQKLTWARPGPRSPPT